MLGLILQSNVKWDEQICLIITKLSKRLYIFQVLFRSVVLFRGGVAPADLKLRAYSHNFTILLLDV